MIKYIKRGQGGRNNSVSNNNLDLSSSNHTTRQRVTRNQSARKYAIGIDNSRLQYEQPIHTSFSELVLGR